MSEPDEANALTVNGSVLPATDHETTRDRLIRATIELFLEGGYEATRVQRIARRAGMTTGAIYANFASKEELLAEAIGQASLLALQSEISPAIEGLTSLEILRLLGNEALGVPATENHGVIIQGIAAATRNPELRSTVVGPIRALGEAVRALLIQAQADGDIDPDLELDAVTYFAMTMTFGAFALKALDWPIPDRDHLDDVMFRLLGGFGKR
jgi:AcrR family transcriptional regulator